MEFFQGIPLSITALAIILGVVTVGVLGRKLKQKKKYHPIGGTVFNQLLNFNRLHHYMTDLATKHKTYRLISPFRNEVYTAYPPNVEYILKTNFENYGKVSSFLDSASRIYLLIFKIFNSN